MARTKDFDPDSAVRRAMELFWCRGYEATSIQDLVDHTGVGRGSLYDTFGSKHGLYLCALDRYREINATLLTSMLQDAGSLREVLRRALTAISEGALADPQRRGCLIVNAAMELSPHDSDTAERVAAAFAGVEDALHDAIVLAQERGEVSRDKDARALARFLLTALQGLRVVGKATPDRARLEGAVDTTLAAMS